MRNLSRAVITGASGMIGQELVKQLIRQGIEVCAVIRPDSKGSKSLYALKDPKLEIIECDLSDLTRLRSRLSRNYDAFFHLGWDSTFGNSRNDLHLQNQNVTYTLDAVLAAKELGCSIFLGAGSQAEYGRVEGKLSPDTPVFPENGYGMAKLCAGQMSRILCEQYEMSHIWCRILSIYGPNDNKKTMVMSAVRGYLKGESPIFTKGEQLWDYLHVEDCAKALYLAAIKGKSSCIYCIGSGKQRPLADYIRIIRDQMNPSLESGIGKLPYGGNPVMFLQADIRTLTEDTGFIPSITFEEGIKNTIVWCKEDMKDENN